MKKLLCLLPALWLWYLPHALAQQWLPGGQGMPIACAFTTSPPTVASGNFIYAQCDLNGKLIVSGGGGGGGGAITAPLGGIGIADALGVSVSQTGTPYSGFAFPSACSGAIGGYGLWSCMVLEMGQPLPGQASAAAVPIGAVKLCDQASVANPITPCQGVKAASTAAAATDPSAVVAISPNGVDPCSQVSATKTPYAFSSSSGEFQLVAPSGSTQVYICSLAVIEGTPAVHVSLVGGTGATCTTGTPAAMLGSTTAANGLAFPVSGGMTFGSGVATVTRTITAGHGVCILQDGTSLVAGGGMYVQQ